MNGMRLLMLAVLVLYETRRAESEKPMAMLKSLLKNLALPPLAVTDGEQAYMVYKCGMVDGTGSSQTELVDCVDQPLAANGSPVPEGTDNAEKAGSEETVVETLGDRDGTAEKEYEQEYGKDQNTEWLFENTPPVEHQPAGPVHPMIEDAKKGVDAIKNKIIQKIHMIKAKLKPKKRPEKPVTETNVPDSTLYTDYTKSTTAVPDYNNGVHTATATPSTAGYVTAGPSTAGYVTAGPSIAGYVTAGPSTAGYVTRKPSTTGSWTIRPTTVTLPPHVECLPRIYYYPMPYPVYWNGVNYPPSTSPANYVYGPSAGYVNGPNAVNGNGPSSVNANGPSASYTNTPNVDYGNPRPTDYGNPRPTIPENMPYPSQRLGASHGNMEQPTIGTWTGPWSRYLHDNNYSKPAYYQWYPQASLRPAQPRPHLLPRPLPQPQPLPQLHLQPQPQTQPQPQPQPQSQPQPEHQPQFQQQPQPQPEHQPQFQQQPQYQPQPQFQPQQQFEPQPLGVEYAGQVQPTSTAQPIAVYPAEENASRDLDRYPEPELDVRTALNGNVVGISSFPARGDISYEGNGAHRYARPQEAQDVNGDESFPPAKDRRHVKSGDGNESSMNAIEMTTSAPKSKIADVRSQPVAV